MQNSKVSLNHICLKGIGYNFCNLLFAFVHIKQFLKEVFFKMAEFLLLGNKFFPSKVDPFLEGQQKQFWKYINSS